MALDMSGSMCSYHDGVEELNRPFVEKRNEFIRLIYEKNKKQVPDLHVDDPSLLCTALAAIDANVSMIATEEPKTKVGIVGFEN